jgi:hypothetical protein
MVQRPHPTTRDLPCRFRDHSSHWICHAPDVNRCTHQIRGRIPSSLGRVSERPRLFIVGNQQYVCSLDYILCYFANNRTPDAAGPAVRAFTSAYIMSIGTLGAVVATWTYIDKDKPLYHVGHSINLAFQALLMAIATCCTLYCHYENRVRAAGKRDSRLSGTTEAEEIKLGYRHPAFRYIP